MTMGPYCYSSGENPLIEMAEREVGLRQPQGLPLGREIHKPIRPRMLTHLIDCHIDRFLERGVVPQAVLDFPSFMICIGDDVGLKFGRRVEGTVKHGEGNETKEKDWFEIIVEKRLELRGFKREGEVFVCKEPQKETPLRVPVDAKYTFPTAPRDMSRRGEKTSAEMLKAIPDHLGHGVRIFPEVFERTISSELDSIKEFKALGILKQGEVRRALSDFLANPQVEVLEGEMDQLFKAAIAKAVERLSNESEANYGEHFEGEATQGIKRFKEMVAAFCKNPSKEGLEALNDEYSAEQYRSHSFWEGNQDRGAAERVWKAFNAFWGNPCVETLSDAYFEIAGGGEWTTGFAQIEEAHRGRLLLSLFEWADIMMHMKLMFDPVWNRHMRVPKDLTDEQVREINAKQFGFLLQTVAELTPYMETEAEGAQA